MAQSLVPPMPLWPVAVYAVAVVILVSLMVGLSYVLGEHHRTRRMGEPYESGVVPTETGRPRVVVKFYLMAMLFVIFDLEAVFIFAWSAVVREAGWSGYLEIIIFVAILAVAFIYLWRENAFDWEEDVKSSESAQRKEFRA